MAASYTGSCFYQAPIDYFVMKMRQIGAAGLKINPPSERPFQGGVQFVMGTGMSFTSYGENIQVTLMWQGNGTHVQIYSECVMPTQIIDMGKNQKQVQKIFKYLEDGMPGLQ